MAGVDVLDGEQPDGRAALDDGAEIGDDLAHRLHRVPDRAERLGVLAVGDGLGEQLGVTVDDGERAVQLVLHRQHPQAVELPTEQGMGEDSGERPGRVGVPPVRWRLGGDVDLVGGDLCRPVSRHRRDPPSADLGPFRPIRVWVPNTGTININFACLTIRRRL
ncbi:hypothetical protein [Actinomadura nitritigenes]|uniref:hypothetical protein n=1 Tax=Actinomadura nitritigenes TaxID=134602 RepID=UPI003D8E7E49